MLMGEKDLEIIILLLAEAADVNIWAHLHHNRVSCSDFRGHKTQKQTPMIRTGSCLNVKPTRG